jgi:RNA polymerase sigma-70 factor (ECF subfamily)
MEDGHETEIPETPVDVAAALESREMQDKVREILEAMPERDRRVLREIFIEERDKDEVCRDFGVDRNYLRVLLHRAKQVFRTTYTKSLTARGQFAGDDKRL